MAACAAASFALGLDGCMDICPVEKRKWSCGPPGAVDSEQQNGHTTTWLLNRGTQAVVLGASAGF